MIMSTVISSAPRRLGAVPEARFGTPCFRPVFAGWRRIANLAGITLWLAALAWFWVWWLEPAHILSPIRYAVASLVLAWVTLIPAYFIVIFTRGKVPCGAPPDHARVAIVVTKAPSEPFSVVRKTLRGALMQRGVRHDTWLADEDPSPETLDWCRRHHVQVSCRKGVADYHRADWPRRTRCKEGNLAYFYDHYGYDRYDFVAQFDADHVPSPDYLRHALAPFADPTVGYVSAPSICDANAGTSWSARGRLHVEASLHGALQVGYNAGWAPLCIGSHYTVRTAALKAIGGLGPELAEDHSTTLMMNAGGWRGVHAVDAIAHGDGPETFTDLVVQEFQWSRSLVTILLEYSPGWLGGLSDRLRFQFLFSQLWYPLFSVMMGVMCAMPMVALATGRIFADVTYAGFIAHMLPLSVVLLALAYWWRSTGLFRPADARILSWEGAAFLFLRWPWALIGSLVAVADRLRGRVAGFRITPKHARHPEALPDRIVAPYLAIAALAAALAWRVKDPGAAAGFYVFNLVTALVYGGLTVLVLCRHARETGAPALSFTPSGIARTLVLLLIAVAIAGSVRDNGLKGLAAMTDGITAFSLTETVYTPAGAGHGRTAPVIRFRPRWYGFSEIPASAPAVPDPQE